MSYQDRRTSQWTTTQTFDDINGRTHTGCVNSYLLWRQYPYKDHNKGYATHEYSMTSKELTRFIRIYMSCIFSWIFQGFKYKIPYPWLGSIKLVKRPSHYKRYLHRQRVRQLLRLKIMKRPGDYRGEFFVPQVKWEKGRFRNKGLWHFRFEKKLVTPFLKQYGAKRYLIYRLDNEGKNY